MAQVAFTFVLLLGAGLLLASFARVLRVDPGFVPERVATASVALPRSRYADDPARWRFTDEALRRVRALPGVVAAGATSSIPFGGSHNDSVILAEGYLMKPGESVISPSQVDVTPGYFEAMGVKLLEGRFFGDQDTAGVPRVAIVDRKLARRFWPDQEPARPTPVPARQHRRPHRHHREDRVPDGGRAWWPTSSWTTSPRASGRWAPTSSRWRRTRRAS